jgi:aryl-alcohol dehydrogenase-like predicted oxidoreductase/enamine deaminase RidA (YjgF/YER057c/UK114 family)
MPTAVERTTLAPGLEISRVLTGLWQIADLEREGRTVETARAVAAMNALADAGFTTFDMADHYGSAELLAGAFRQGRGGGTELLTKWVPPPGPVSREAARGAVERALGRLRAPALDLLQFHAWSYAHPGWLDALFHLQELKREGLLRHLGLTNFDTAHLQVALASGLEIVSNQVCFSVLDRRPRRRMVELCRTHAVKLLAYGTVGGGWLSDRWLGRDEPDWERTGTWSQMKYGRFLRAVGGWSALQRVLRTLSEVAARHGVSVANVATRFVLEQPGMAGVILGARLGESEHVAENLRLFGFALTEKDHAEIEAVAETLDAIPGEPGDEYRRPPFLTASGDLRHHVSDFPAPYAVKAAPGGRSLCLSGTPWEDLAGFSRAVRTGSRILVSGTTATHGDRVIGGADPAAQAHFVIDKIEGALQSLGGRLEDVVRTRVYVRRLQDWEAVARVHGERFASIQPANTLVRADLVGEEYLVEMEAEAEVPERPGQ